MLVLSSPPLATTPEDVRVFATNGDIAALAEAVVAEDLEVRRAAFAALEIVGISEEGDRALITALNDEEPEIRRDAARILGEAGNPRAIDSLIALLGDPFTFVRTEALEALIKLDEPLGPLIHDTLEGSEEARLELIQRDDPRILVPLVNALGHLDSKIRHTARGIISLYRDARVVPLLCEKLDSRSSDARWNAAELLQEMGDERAVQSLIRTLTDGESRVRIAVTTALGQIADERATEPLIRTLSDPDPLVREAAAYALGDFDAEAVVPPAGQNAEGSRCQGARGLGLEPFFAGGPADPGTIDSPRRRLVNGCSPRGRGGPRIPEGLTSHDAAYRASRR